MKLQQTVHVTLNTEETTWEDVEVSVSAHASISDVVKQTIKELENDDPSYALSEEAVTSIVIVWSIAH